MPFFIYILKTSAGTLYTGITNNLKKRLNTHFLKNKQSSKYMRSFESFELVYVEDSQDRAGALKREWEIKKMTKIKKNSLINSQLNKIKFFNIE